MHLQDAVHLLSKPLLCVTALFRYLETECLHSGSAEQPQKKKQRIAASAAEAADLAADLSKAQKAVKGLLKLKVATVFSAPVSEKEVPGYGLVIQNPMDLGTVLDKLKGGEYASAGEPLLLSHL